MSDNDRHKGLQCAGSSFDRSHRFYADFLLFLKKMCIATALFLTVLRAVAIFACPFYLQLLWCFYVIKFESIFAFFAGHWS